MNDVWHDLRRLAADRGNPLVELDPKDCFRAALVYPDGRREQIEWNPIALHERWEIVLEEST